VKEKVEDIDITNPKHMAGVREVIKLMLRKRVFDRELSGEDWSRNYGVTKDGRVVLRNPEVLDTRQTYLTRETLPTDAKVQKMTIAQITGITSDIWEGRLGFKRESRGPAYYWGRSDNFEIDPFGLISSIRQKFANRNKLNTYMQNIKMMQGAA
jgi:hypothetical protein